MNSVIRDSEFHQTQECGNVGRAGHLIAGHDGDSRCIRSIPLSSGVVKDDYHQTKVLIIRGC